jgi:hypothetical protein
MRRACLATVGEILDMMEMKLRKRRGGVGVGIESQVRSRLFGVTAESFLA